MRKNILLLIVSTSIIYSQIGEATTTTTTSTPGNTSTTTGKPVPEIKPTPSTVATSPPLTTPPPESKHEGMNKGDMNILKWLLSNDPEKPLEGIGIRTQILKPLLKNPYIKEALEALRQKLQNLDSQDPNDPQVQKVVKEFRTTIMKNIAQIKFKNVKNKKGRTTDTIPKQIAIGQTPDKPLPLPAKPFIVPEHRTVPTEPPTTTTEEIIPPPNSSTTTSSTTSTTQKEISVPPGTDPVLAAMLALLQQLLAKQQQSANTPQEIKDLQDTLSKFNNASQKCKDEFGKKTGATSTMNEAITLAGKSQWTDQEKQRATQLKTDICNFTNSIPDCSGVCSIDGPPSANPLDACKTTNSSCSSCPNTDAKSICELYKSNVLQTAGTDCKDKINKTPDYTNSAWFNQFLTNKPSDDNIKSKHQEFKNAVCIPECAIYISASSNFCN